MRICGMCQELLPFYEFSRSQIQRYGDQAHCKYCVAARTGQPVAEPVTYIQPVAEPPTHIISNVFALPRRECASCGVQKIEDDFSRAQISRHGAGARCITCVQGSNIVPFRKCAACLDMVEKPLFSINQWLNKGSDARCKYCVEQGIAIGQGLPDSETESEDDDYAFGCSCGRCHSHGQYEVDYERYDDDDDDDGYGYDDYRGSSLLQSMIYNDYDVIERFQQLMISSSPPKPSPESLLKCSRCACKLDRNCFSDTQLTKRENRKCIECVQAMNTTVSVQKIQKGNAKMTVTTSSSSTSSSSSSSNLCITCYAKPKNCVFIPCGHMSCCFECAKKCKNQCPVCRKNCKIQKVFL